MSPQNKNTTSSKQFLETVQMLAEQEKGHATVLEVVAEYCEKNNIEVEVAAEIIKSDKIIKNKIAVECVDRSLVKGKKRARLPV